MLVKRMMKAAHMLSWQLVYAVAAWYVVAEFPFSKLHFVYELY